VHLSWRLPDIPSPPTAWSLPALLDYMLWAIFHKHGGKPSWTILIHTSFLAYPTPSLIMLGHQHLSFMSVLAYLSFPSGFSAGKSPGHIGA
jgi:hypothetical protein